MANKFEKEIKQKLDSLKITPSGKAWEGIEKRIEKKNDYRWKYFILIFLLLAIAGSGILLLDSKKNNDYKVLKTSLELRKDKSASTLKNDSSSYPSLTKKKTGTNKISEKESLTPSTSHADAIKNENFFKQKKAITVFKSKGHLKLTLEKGVSSENENVTISQNPKKEKFKEELPGELILQNIDSITNKDQKTNVDNKIESLGKINQDNTTQFVQPQQKSEVEDSIRKPNDKNAVQKASKAKWSLGITISGGKSLLGNDPLGINNNTSADYLSSPGSSTGAGQGVPSSYSPSEIKNSLAFIAGLNAEKEIFSRHKLSIGINYKYFSTLNKVGSKIDSTLTGNYFSGRQAAVNKYRNNFNYLELPVSLKFQLSNSKSLTLYWQFGINISQLISSNALQFEKISGLYYNDNSLFNKTQFGVSTGFSATLFAKQKNPISIGPYFYYSPSAISDKGLYNKKHFTFIGIRTEVSFKKNK